MTIDYQPIILIGAARSGTKLVRDILAPFLNVDKVPYDVNYLWRLGNENLPHDELTADLLSESLRDRIRRQFRVFHTGRPALIEKSVSNCLRVPFVAAVFPEARYIHLLRNGADVIESVYRQWLAPPDWKYIFRKALAFPVSLAPEYAASYAGRLLNKAFLPRSAKIGTWGPRYHGIDADVKTKDLLEICAIQWAYSVKKACAGFQQIPRAQIYTLYYESFVSEPERHLHELADFCGLAPTARQAETLLSQISRDNVGRGAHSLGAEQLRLIAPYLQRVTQLVADTNTR